MIKEWGLKLIFTSQLIEELHHLRVISISWSKLLLQIMKVLFIWIWLASLVLWIMQIWPRLFVIFDSTLTGRATTIWHIFIFDFFFVVCWDILWWMLSLYWFFNCICNFLFESEPRWWLLSTVSCVRNLFILFKLDRL